ncbi:MAG: trehalose 6-phosphate synthase, partial [Candidatus Zapsychrus exili]|nr:trehalose 6-phosphate synthase [Candidatus Zapsychrus exili]
TLDEFYKSMFKTKDARIEIVNFYLNYQPISAELRNILTGALDVLENIPKEGDQYILKLDDTKNISLDLSYEINELKKDLFFLDNSAESFYAHLSELHNNFNAQVNETTEKLRGIAFKNFITDRDGTVNNYCGRYVSSIQSIYNAVFLTRFANKDTINSIILTSAPLDNIGLADISVTQKNMFIYAGSKGREYFDKQGARHCFPIEEKKQRKLTELNSKLSDLVKTPEYKMFSLIGSGLQFKFGQTTIARQDITNSILAKDSNNFLELIERLVDKLDPQKELFKIEDTGKDIEIILTIDSNDKNEQAKDFDKGDGINFLNDSLNLKLKDGPNLICGDTSSDVPMVEASMAKTNNTNSVFVTTNDELKAKVSAACPNAMFVDTPDVLIAALNNLGK